MSTNSILTALAANATVAIAKTIGAIITGSASLTAEAIHSFADCGNQGLLIWGSKTSDKRPDTDHPFGYGKNAFFWSFIVALVLFTLGGVYSIYEGVHKIFHPEPLKHVGWAFGILVLGFLLEAFSFKTCVSEIKETYPGKSMRWFFKETRNSSLLVIFGEDLAALAGLGIAAFFLGLSVLTNNPIYDGVGSLAVGVLLTGVAAGLFFETKALLIGQSVEPQIRRDLHVLLSDWPTVLHTYECKTLMFGDSALLLLRIRFVEHDSSTALVNAIDELEAEISKRFPIFTLIFVEPDNKFKDF